MVGLLQAWNHRREIEDIGDAQMKVLYGHLRGRLNMIDKEAVTPVQLIESLLFTNAYFLKHFGKIDVTLDEYQKMARGKAERPLRGLPDVLASMSTVSHEKEKVKGYSGESYILLAKYTKEGLPIIETIHAYGNSSKPKSPNYTDQMKGFTNLKLKPMTLDVETVRKEAVRIYSPE